MRFERREAPYHRSFGAKDGANIRQSDDEQARRLAPHPEEARSAVSKDEVMAIRYCPTLS
ncbi:hypothetical protein CES86_1535 [Brucella lupini]|uniref:Uncharacterized protein n=1 Tax=Brucella lupini TaxID=255457 RepID=A0A256GVT4_9HYPH|nr:hypothetical protein CES86_1535 [Brucella lupini]